MCPPPAVTSGQDKHYPSHATDGRAAGNPSKRKAKTKGASFLLGKWDELRSHWKEAGGSQSKKSTRVTCGSHAVSF